MTQWEYLTLLPAEAGLKVGTKMEDINFEDIKPTTDKGWEIISLLPNLLIFKREIEDDRPKFLSGGPIKK